MNLAFRATAALVGLALGSCVQLTWRDARVGVPLAESDLVWALDERPALGAALERLGAPELVRDLEGRGVEVVWLWRRSDSYGVGVSLPVNDAYSASFQWDASDDDARGLRLVFDREGAFLEGSRGAVLAVRPGA